eukprot:jgi/Chrpa1/3956/Chrysochromulina_OHIO_Genome00010209-RA
MAETLDSALSFLAARGPSAPALKSSEPEVEYVFVGLEPGSTAQLSSEVILKDLLSDAPRVTVGEHSFRGTYDEDIGSTMIFDCASLKRMADAQSREARELMPQDVDEHPLVCVMTKRLRLQAHRAGWTPTFRTGGGFSLTQHSPRPRAAHDNLPPPAAGTAQPKYLADLLEKLLDPTAVPSKLQPKQADKVESPRLGSGRKQINRLAAINNLELPPHPSSPRLGSPRATNGTLWAPTPTLLEAVSGAPQVGDEPIPMAAASSAAPAPAPAASAAASAGAPAPARLRRGLTPTAPQATLTAEPVSRGLRGFTPRHGDHVLERTSPSAGSHRAHHGRELASAERYAIQPGSPRAALGSSSSTLGGGGGLLDSAEGDAALPTADAATTMGPRSPPTAPAARDESALSRVSVYSMRPCMQDADLSARFGIKAAYRSSSPIPTSMVAGSELAAPVAGSGGAAPVLAAAMQIMGEPRPMVQRTPTRSTSPRGGARDGAKPPAPLRVNVVTPAGGSRPPPAPSPAVSNA